MPALARVEVSQAALAAQLTGPGGLVTGYLMRQLRAIRNRAVLRAPVDTGNLRASIVTGTVQAGRIVQSDHPEVRGLVVTGAVGTPVEYAVLVHEGTAPHVIRPTTPRTYVMRDGKRVAKGGVLAWGGRPPTRFATSVRHPGTKPRPFLRTAMEETLTAAG